MNSIYELNWPESFTRKKPVAFEEVSVLKNLPTPKSKTEKYLQITVDVLCDNFVLLVLLKNTSTAENTNESMRDSTKLNATHPLPKKPYLLICTTTDFFFSRVVEWNSIILFLLPISKGQYTKSCHVCVCTLRFYPCSAIAI